MRKRESSTKGTKVLGRRFTLFDIVSRTTRFRIKAVTDSTLAGGAFTNRRPPYGLATVQRTCDGRHDSDVVPPAAHLRVHLSPLCAMRHQTRTTEGEVGCLS